MYLQCIEGALNDVDIVSVQVVADEHEANDMEPVDAYLFIAVRRSPPLLHVRRDSQQTTVQTSLHHLKPLDEASQQRLSRVSA